jgi:hypothetical protein
MALLNYTTSISVHKTLSEIQEILVEHGARKVMIDYDENKRVNSLNFTVFLRNTEIPFSLKAKPSAILKIMQKQKACGEIKTKVDYEQAERVAWRIFKTWIDSNLALLEAEQMGFEQLFLSSIMNKNGETLFEIYENGAAKFLLTGGDD